MRRPSYSYRDVILRFAPPPVRRRWPEVAANDDVRSDREAQRMAREWKRLGAPGRAALMRAGRTCGSREGLLLGLWSPLAARISIPIVSPTRRRRPNLARRADLQRRGS